MDKSNKTETVASQTLNRGSNALNTNDRDKSGGLQTEQLIQQLTTTSDPELVQTLYRQWAATYDEDLAQYGYIAPALAVADFISRQTLAQPAIYDAGCGTGQVGRLLKEAGLQHIDGADFSAEMLAQAESTGVYRQLEHADYSGPINVADNQYDAVISVGVYTRRFEGHFIGEMLRILKPGGLLYFTARPHYFEEDAAAELHHYLLSGALSSLSMELKPYIKEQNAAAWYIAARTRQH